jgi:phosphoribosylglycinamide formyltransferase-1
MSRRIAVLFSGVGSTFAYLLEQLPARGISVAVALTNRQDAGGIDVAKRFGIPLEIVESNRFERREDFDREVLRVLEPYGVDLVVLAGFMRILTPHFTESVRAINLHPSLLPRHKGLDAIRRSWDDAYPDGGATVHWVSAELDGGTTILQKSISKKGLDYPRYYAEIRRLEKTLLLEAIDRVLVHDLDQN